MSKLTSIGDLELIFYKNNNWHIRCSNFEFGVFATIELALKWYDRVSTYQRELNE